MTNKNDGPGKGPAKPGGDVGAQKKPAALIDLKATEIAAEIGGTFAQCDVTSEASIDSALAAVRKAGLGANRYPAYVAATTAGGLSASSSAGRRWRTEIQPRIREFIRTLEFRRKEQDAEKRGLMGYLTGGNKVAAKDIAAPVSERVSERAAERPAERLKVKANGHLNGTNGHHAPVEAGE